MTLSTNCDLRHKSAGAASFQKGTTAEKTDSHKAIRPQGRSAGDRLLARDPVAGIGYE